MKLKRKYKRDEVLEIINERDGKHEKELAYERNVNAELKEEVKRLTSELEAYKNRDNLIDATIKTAENKADEIKKTAELKYIAECERLKNFKERWSKYFGYLSETYPYYKAVSESRDILSALDVVLGKSSSSIDMIEELDLTLDRLRIGNNEEIKKHIALTTPSENGFDMDAVLNPGELDLGDLCKELGLMEDE